MTSPKVMLEVLSLPSVCKGMSGMSECQQEAILNLWFYLDVRLTLANLLPNIPDIPLGMSGMLLVLTPLTSLWLTLHRSVSLGCQIFSKVILLLQFFILN